MWICPVCITVLGCGGSPLVGATVSITGGPSGTTGADGVAILDAGAAGIYTITVSYPGYTTSFDSYTVVCGHGLIITLTPCISTGSHTATDTIFGLTWTLSYLGSYTLGWSGVATYSYPGSAGCPAVMVPVTLTIFCDHTSMTGFSAKFSWPLGTGCAEYCPGATPTKWTYTAPLSVTCSPFSCTATFAATAQNCGGPSANGPWGQLASGGADTVTVT